MDKEIGLGRWQGRGEGTKALYVLPRAELPGLVMVNIHPVKLRSSVLMIEMVVNAIMSPN